MDRIFAKSTLREFWEKQAEAEQYLKTWYDIAKSSNWSNPNEVKNTCLLIIRQMSFSHWREAKVVKIKQF